MTGPSEDELTNAIIQNYRGIEAEATFHPEAPYNYYGDRGVVDIYIEDPGGASLYEIKSEHAVQSSESGANSILRQFNRMRRYFFQDESRDPPIEEVGKELFCSLSFQLIFSATEANYEHLCANKEMYAQAVQQDVFEIEGYGRVDFHKRVTITMRSVESPGEPMPVFTSRGGAVDETVIEMGLERVGLDRLDPTAFAD